MLCIQVDYTILIGPADRSTAIGVTLKLLSDKISVRWMIAAGIDDSLKGLRPLPPSPANSRMFGIVIFSKNVYFCSFPMESRVWEGLESIGNGCGFKWTDSQLISSHIGPFSKIFKISIILVLIRVVPGPSKSAVVG